MAGCTSEGGGRIDVMDTFKGRLMCERTERVAGNEWMVGRRENHADQRGGVNGRHSAAGERRKEG
jgi:hypothetical protein